MHGTTDRHTSMSGDETRPCDDNLLEELRQANPIDPDELPSSREPESMELLNRILESEADD